MTRGSTYHAVQFLGSTSEIGHEEAVYRRTDHRIFAGGGCRGEGQAPCVSTSLPTAPDRFYL